MTWRQTLARWIAGSPAQEGQQRSAPYVLPLSNGWLGAEGDTLNWWQRGYDVRREGHGAMVEACVAAYGQTVAMLPGSHWRLLPNGGRERVTGSALSRVLRKPNPYQTASDLLLQQVSQVLYEGNSYALGLRNARNEVYELHLFDPRTSRPLVGADGSVFYHLEGNELVERMLDGPVRAPARDVIHLRLFCPQHPLVGVSPITATALQAAAADAALAQQAAFFRNQSRPSFVLSTDQILTKEQTAELRERWEEQAKGLRAGGTPILTAGLKPQALGVSAQDTQLIQTLRMSDMTIATAMRVPHVMVGLSPNGPQGSTESLMQFWLASGLGFMLNHVEEAWGALFGLRGQPDEYLELDTGALLRPAFRERVEALARATQSGVMAPNEARADMELPAVPYGDEPRVQQQQVPLSAWGERQQPKPPAAPDAAPPAPGPEDAP